MASSTILSFLLFALLLALSRAATFEIVNVCPFTVWAAAVPEAPLPLKSEISSSAFFLSVRRRNFFGTNFLKSFFTFELPFER
ncbi:hypothetical protein C4D60_Mb09t22540 [Musa balbisiana]|uniref:Secreted protein n=1 Tax=Musa balbisiana TaxID=52838 RepID=A0A4S8IIA8_MUSBA|nr:hypothetical protein C4D60_Mb09t22540 [Musa balbisiana]